MLIQLCYSFKLRLWLGLGLFLVRIRVFLFRITTQLHYIEDPKPVVDGSHN